MGTYGIPRNPYSFAADNVKMEELLHANNGRKVYYSHSFYDRSFFYDKSKLHDGPKYFALRKAYGAENVFTEVFDKVVTKNGIL